MAKYSFQKAVEATPEISTAYRSGLQALKRSDRSSVAVSDPWILDGSVDVDTAVQEKYPNDNRWDYAIGYFGKVCYVEVHPAFVWAQTGKGGILPRSSQARKLAAMGITVAPVHKLQ